VCLTGLTGIEPLSGSCSVSPARTGLTGGAHRSDRCGSVDSRVGFSAAFLGSEGCVLVPRPTLVVSRRRVLEAAFVLLEFSSPSRRIFIGSHSLPPLSGSPYRSFTSAGRGRTVRQVKQSRKIPSSRSQPYQLITGNPKRLKFLRQDLGEMLGTPR
jgi:hypothetical protein